MERGPSIYDVARVAGVAASTVSRAISRPGRVSSCTAQRVFAAAREVGYPFEERQRLIGHRTRSLAVVVADITNPYYAEMVRGAQEAASACGFTVVLSHTPGEARLQRDWIERELVNVAGVLLTDTRVSHDAIRMLARQRPVVMLNRRVPDVPCVIADIARGIRQAVEHLVDLGHTSVTYMAGPEGSWADGMRWVALMEACHELELRLHRVGPCAVPTVKAGLDATIEVLAQRPTAVIAYNDLMAIGVMKGMRLAGLRVPDDVSVIGFDNVVLCEIVDPELTTVASPLRAMGITGVNNLIAVASGAKPSREPVVLPVKLLVRGSTGRRTRSRPHLGVTSDGARERLLVTGG
jgi:DNA-binding LacI/PurR family transcriptional regulator